MALVVRNVRTAIEIDLNKVFVIRKYACYLYGVFKQGSLKVFGNVHTSNDSCEQSCEDKLFNFESLNLADNQLDALPLTF